MFKSSLSLLPWQLSFLWCWDLQLPPIQASLLTDCVCFFCVHNRGNNSLTLPSETHTFLPNWLSDWTTTSKQNKKKYKIIFNLFFREFKSTGFEPGTAPLALYGYKQMHHWALFSITSVSAWTCKDVGSVLPGKKRSVSCVRTISTHRSNFRKYTHQALY